MRRLALIAVTVAAATACGRPQPETAPPPRRVLPAEEYRPLDGLLASPALQRLVELQIDRDGAALADALDDADARVRARAAFALGSVQDTAAVTALIPLLDDTTAAVRADAAFALGQTPTPAGAAALLARVLVETDTAVLVTLLDAVGKSGGEAELWALGDARLTDPRDGSPAIGAALALAYARFGMRGLHDQAAADWIVAALRAEDRAVRQNAAYYFVRSRDPQPWAHRRGELVDALAEYGRWDRAAMHLLGALARLEDADDVPIFAQWLDSPDWAIRVSAARALAQRDELPEARAALVRALRDRSWHVRVAAATGLASAPLTRAEADSLSVRVDEFVGEPAVHGALLRAVAGAGYADWTLQHWLGHSDAALRRYGMPALAVVPGIAAFEALEAAARDSVPIIAAAALDALTARRARDMSDASDERYFDVYATALRTRDLAIASTAATALGDSAFAEHGAGPLLQSVLLQMRAPDDLEAMVEMLRALGALRDETAVALLRETRGGRWPELRRAAADALTRITGEPPMLPPAEPPSTRMIQWDWLAQWGSAPRLRVETERGTIVLALSVEQAPLTAQTLLTLASEGRFDGVPFHRVVPNFVVQGGDVGRRDGWGGPGFAIRSEFTRIPYLRGTAGMASSGKDTEGSQWFVTHGFTPHLDGRYTAFGTLVEGVGVLDEIREGDVALRVTAEPTP